MQIRFLHTAAAQEKENVMTRSKHAQSRHSQPSPFNSKSRMGKDPSSITFYTSRAVELPEMDYTTEVEDDGEEE